MKYGLLYCLLVILFATGCSKNNDQQVAIYMLKSFTATATPSSLTSPPTTVITNAVIENTPLVADNDILSYLPSETTFMLRKDIKPIIERYGSDKAFVVMVNNEPVYFGMFHPAYYSSINFGVATIDPIFFNNNALKIQYATFSGYPDLAALDKRNDRRILNVFRVTGRLK